MFELPKTAKPEDSEETQEIQEFQQELSQDNTNVWEDIAAAAQLEARTRAGTADNQVSSAPKNSQVTQERITQLIEKLGSENPAEKKAAQDELLVLGKPALAQVRQALKHEKPEIAKQAQDLLIAILINELGSKGFNDREAARKELGSFGRAALPQILSAMRHPDIHIAKLATDLFDLRAREPLPPDVLANALKLSRQFAELLESSPEKLVSPDFIKQLAVLGISPLEARTRIEALESQRAATIFEGLGTKVDTGKVAAIDKQIAELAAIANLPSNARLARAEALLGTKDPTKIRAALDQLTETVRLFPESVRYPELLLLAGRTGALHNPAFRQAFAEHKGSAEDLRLLARYKQLDNLRQELTPNTDPDGRIYTTMPVPHEKFKDLIQQADRHRLSWRDWDSRYTELNEADKACFSTLNYDKINGAYRTSSAASSTLHEVRSLMRAVNGLYELPGETRQEYAQALIRSGTKENKELAVRYLTEALEEGRSPMLVSLQMLAIQAGGVQNKAFMAAFEKAGGDRASLLELHKLNTRKKP